MKAVRFNIEATFSVKPGEYSTMKDCLSDLGETIDRFKNLYGGINSSVTYSSVIYDVDTLCIEEIYVKVTANGITQG